MSKAFPWVCLPLCALMMLLTNPAHAASNAAQIEQSLLDSRNATSLIASLPVMNGSEFNVASEQFLVVQYGVANQALIDAAASGGRSLIYQAGYGNQATIIQH